MAPLHRNDCAVTLEVFVCVYLAMVDDQLEESVHQQDAVREDTAAVQQNRLEREKHMSSYSTPLQSLNDTI